MYHNRFSSRQEVQKQWKKFIGTCVLVSKFYVVKFYVQPFLCFNNPELVTFVKGGRNGHPRSVLFDIHLKFLKNCGILWHDDYWIACTDHYHFAHLLWRVSSCRLLEHKSGYNFETRIHVLMNFFITSMPPVRFWRGSPMLWYTLYSVIRCI